MMIFPTPRHRQAEIDVSKTTSPLIQMQGIGKVYRTGTHTLRALRSVELDLHKGEFVVLLGPAGSGKSTLLNILGGWERPTSGTVIFERRELAKSSEAVLANYRRRHVGFIVQSPKLVPQLTARENVALVTRLVDRPMPDWAALALVGLEKRGNFFPSQLTASERYLVAVARALAKRPKILLCDQPTETLMLEPAIRVVKTLALASAILDLTTIVSTRSPKMKSIAERVVHLLDGRLIGNLRRHPG